MSYQQQLLDIQQAAREKEEREMDELVQESQDAYDRTAEFLGYQEPKEDTNEKSDNKED